MSRWFRHYAGMMRDEKLVRVAVKSGQPVHLVTWVWGALLESASEINDGGRYDFDAAEAAYFLRCDVADTNAVLCELENSGRIHEGVVVRWGDRQFDSDISRDRQRRYREKRSGDNIVASRDSLGDGNAPSRDGGVTVQDTDTDTDTDTTSLRSVAREAKPARRKTAIKFDWEPSEKNREDARRYDLSVSTVSIEAEKFRDHHLKNGSVFKDWNAAWRTWCQRVKEFQPRGQGPPQKPQTGSAKLVELLTKTRGYEEDDRRRDPCLIESSVLAIRDR